MGTKTPMLFLLFFVVSVKEIASNPACSKAGSPCSGVDDEQDPPDAERVYCKLYPESCSTVGKKRDYQSDAERKYCDSYPEYCNVVGKKRDYQSDEERKYCDLYPEYCHAVVGEKRDYQSVQERKRKLCSLFRELNCVPGLQEDAATP